MAATASESSKHARVESEQDKPVSADINCIAQLYRNFVQCDFSSQNLIFLLCTLVAGWWMVTFVLRGDVAILS